MPLLLTPPPLLLKLLIILNLGWSLSAFLYDWPQLVTLPLWAIPFIVICPLYPLLLAGIWTSKLYSSPFPTFFTALASMGSTLFGILALVFYPMIMLIEGFSWTSVGQILWVSLYALQGGWLLFTTPLSLLTRASALLWLLLSLTVLFLSQSYGYLGIAVLPPPWQIGLYAGAVITVITLALFGKRLAPNS